VVHQHDLLAVARRSGRDHAQLPDGRPLQRRGGGDRVQPAGPAAGEGHSSTRHNRALRLHPGVPLRGREGERVARGEASADISTGSLRNSILPEWRATRIVPGQRAIAAVTEQPVAGFAKDVRRSVCTVVVPCYNEALRLDRGGFLAFASHGPVELIFVDDGSTDGTGHLLDELCGHLRAAGVQARALSLSKNRGKGEAVRLGMLDALRRGAPIVGYFDADLATPPGEMSRLIRTMLETPADVALAARVALLGRKIVRKASRHYLGRVFATVASLILRMPVYDTQCGAKAFRRTPALEAALASPFSARWAFDVELLGRLRAGTSKAAGLPMEAFIEMPLQSWRDVGNSTLTFAAFPLLGIELLRIAFALRKWRAA